MKGSRETAAAATEVTRAPAVAVGTAGASCCALPGRAGKGLSGFGQRLVPLLTRVWPVAILGWDFGYGHFRDPKIDRVNIDRMRQRMEDDTG